MVRLRKCSIFKVAGTQEGDKGTVLVSPFFIDMNTGDGSVCCSLNITRRLTRITIFLTVALITRAVGL